MYVDLYKFTTNLYINLNAFYYTITGGLVSYYFTHARDTPHVRVALWIPVLMSLGFTVGGYYAATVIRRAIPSYQKLAESLEITDPPHVALLPAFIYGGSSIAAIITLGIVIIIATQ